MSAIRRSLLSVTVGRLAHTPIWYRTGEIVTTPQADHECEHPGRSGLTPMGKVRTKRLGHGRVSVRRLPAGVGGGTTAGRPGRATSVPKFRSTAPPSARPTWVGRRQLTTLSGVGCGERDGRAMLPLRTPRTAGAGTRWRPSPSRGRPASWRIPIDTSCLYGSGVSGDTEVVEEGLPCRCAESSAAVDRGSAVAGLAPSPGLRTLGRDRRHETLRIDRMSRAVMVPAAAGGVRAAARPRRFTDEVLPRAWRGSKPACRQL